jgi:hypothetical protein
MFISAATVDAIIQNATDSDFDEERDPENTELEEDDDNEVFAELVRESKSTRAGYSVGEAAYNGFAKLQRIPLLADITLADLKPGADNKIVKAFNSFATYLMTKKMKNGKHFRPFCQVQYLSNVKNLLAKKFPRAVLLKKNHDECLWYTDLMFALKLRGRAAAIKRGENVRDRTQGIRRTLLIRLCDHLLKVGSAKALEQRAILLTLYHSVGRGGEVSTLNFNNLRWSEDDEMLWTGWNELKTGRNTEISYHEDYDSYQVDQIHALACYIITAEGKLKGSADPDEPDWLFPDFANLADGGASTKATAILRALVGVVEGLDAKHTSHGLRAGPTDDMAMNRVCDVVCMIARGNWDWTGECQLFGYIFNPLHVSRAGKSLAHWPDPLAHVFVHRLLDADGMDDADRKSLAGLAHLLFCFGPKDLGPRGRLVKFRDVMLASLLTNFEGMREKFGREHAVVAQIIHKATRLNITVAMLDGWGKKIRLDYELRNATPEPTSSDGVAFAALTESFKNLQAENLVLKAEVKEVKDCCGRVEGHLEQLLTSMTIGTSDASATPSKRRRVSVSSPPGRPAVSTFFVPQKPKVAQNPKPTVVSHDAGLMFPTLLTKLTLANVLSRVTLEGVRYEQSNSFGANVHYKVKSKVVRAIKYAREKAEAAELIVLDRKMVKETDAGYEEHHEAVTATVDAVVARVFLSLTPYKDIKLAAGSTAALLKAGQVYQYLSAVQAHDTKEAAANQQQAMQFS